MSHIKCPQCSGQGYSQIEEGRKYFRCPTCGLSTLLKLLTFFKQEEPAKQEPAYQEALPV